MSSGRRWKELLRSRQKIEAIKRVRDQLHLDLKSAKDLVDQHEIDMGLRRASPGCASTIGGAVLIVSVLALAAGL